MHTGVKSRRYDTVFTRYSGRKTFISENQFSTETRGFSTSINLLKDWTEIPKQTTIENNIDFRMLDDVYIDRVDDNWRDLVWFRPSSHRLQGPVYTQVFDLLK